MLALRMLLRTVAPVRFVVVTDRYPPRSVGGAEVSLHLALAAHPKQDTLVVTFATENVLPRTYAIDGVRVLELPRQANWPNQHRPAGMPVWLARRPDPRGDVSVAERLYQAKPRGGPVLDHLEFAGSLGTELLGEVFALLRPTLIHADNYRSILLVANSHRPSASRVVGLVRDNRFVCVRHDQSVRVAQTPCQTCEFTCAAEDLPDDPELQAGELRRASEFRLASLRKMDTVIVTSRYLQGRIVSLVGRDRVVRVPNPTDDVGRVDGFLSGVAELPGTNALIVGMLNENKGQLELVRNLERLVSLVPDLTLHFAGRGPRIEKQMRRVLAELDLAGRVVFHDQVSRQRLYELYARCQLALLPTIWPEPFGRVPLEAGLARRPVVAFAVGGLSESIVDGETGILVQPGNMTLLAAGVEQLAKNPELRRRMGHAARDHVLTNYGPSLARKLLEKVWSSLEENT